jgi:hypothetical protein
MRTFAISLLLLFALPLAAEPAFADVTVAASTSSPVLQATQSADTGWGLVEQYGPIWGAMLLAFAIASRVLAKNETEHWIGQGRWLAAVVAGVGVLGAILEAHFGDGSWAGVIVTLVAGIKLLLSPTAPEPKERPDPPQYSGIELMLVLVVAIAAIGCGPQGPGPVIGQAVVDCTGDNRADIDALFLELSPLVVTGHPDWATVYQRAKHAGTAIGGCVLAELVQTYLGGRRAVATDDSWNAHMVLEEFRSNEAAGATFKTRFGDL